jgi:hypothetical protein
VETAYSAIKLLGKTTVDVVIALDLPEYLQWKVEYLRNDIEMLEVQKTKSTNDSYQQYKR